MSLPTSKVNTSALFLALRGFWCPFLGWKLTAPRKPSSHNSGKILEPDVEIWPVHLFISLAMQLFAFLVDSCRMHVIKWSDGDCEIYWTHSLSGPVAQARQDLPLIWTGKINKEMKLSEKPWKTEAVLSLSCSPYGRLPMELHRMRAHNYLSNKASAFIARIQTTWPMISG